MSENKQVTKLVFFGISDVGQKRTNNEDHFIVADLTRKMLGVEDNRVISRMVYHEVGPRGTLLAVADGLGGHKAGEVASQIAVDAMVKTLFESDNPDLSPAQQLVIAIKTAHRDICLHQEEHPQTRGMSSTLTAMHVGRDRITVAQVGDSRAYCYTNGKLKRLTEDQTIVSLLQKKGMLTDEEAKTHPDRNVVLQAMGQSKKVEPELKSFRFRDGDCVLLCSDGLTSFISEQDVEAIFREEKQENVRCQRLVDAANAAGGGDNITVLIARLLC